MVIFDICHATVSRKVYLRNGSPPAYVELKILRTKRRACPRVMCHMQRAHTDEERDERQVTVKVALKTAIRASPALEGQFESLWWRPEGQWFLLSSPRNPGEDHWGALRASWPESLVFFFFVGPLGTWTGDMGNLINDKFVGIAKSFNVDNAPGLKVIPNLALKVVIAKASKMCGSGLQAVEPGLTTSETWCVSVEIFNTELHRRCHRKLIATEI